MSKKRKIIRDSSDEDCDYVENEEYKFPDENTKKQFYMIRGALERDDLDIINILKANISIEDKKNLFELFEIYTNYEDLTLQKVELKKEIKKELEESIKRYKIYNSYSEKKHKEFDNLLEELKNIKDKNELKYTILDLNCELKVKKTIYTQYERYLTLVSTDDEKCKLNNWLNWVIKLPYNNVRSICNGNNIKKILENVSKKLDEKLYGMRNVKEQVLLILNSKLLNPHMKKTSIGLIGPPGCGKTSIARILAESIDFPFAQICLGGVQSPSFLKGHEYTYIGSEPGEITKSLVKMNYNNGILFFDEYDKISENKDVCSTLLHITDSTQNNTYNDNFIGGGIDIDLSNLWFFYSMNDKPTNEALSDRIFYIYVDGYTQLDKFNIVKNYLLKKCHETNGWKSDSLQITHKGIEVLIDKVSPQEIKGIRSLENAVNEVCNKINFLYHNQDKKGKINLDISFNLNRKVKFPFVIEKEDVDILLKRDRI